MTFRPEGGDDNQGASSPKRESFQYMCAVGRLARCSDPHTVLAAPVSCCQAAGFVHFEGHFVTLCS